MTGMYEKTLILVSREGRTYEDTLPKTNIAPEKLVVGRQVSFWEGLFSGDMLVFGGVEIAR